MKALFYFFIFVLSLCLVSWFSFQKFVVWSTDPHVIRDEVVIDFLPGTKLDKLSADLHQAGVVSHDLLFRALVKYFAEYQKFQAGKYRFIDAVSPKEIIATFVAGNTYNPVVLEYTIPEGYTFKQVATKLASFGVGNLAEILVLKTDREFLSSLKIPSVSIEGYLYPATYTFTELPNPRRALSVAVEEFWRRLPEDYENRVNEKGLTLDQAITFASLIELETANLDEKPLVSEVIWRRLNDKGPLGIDATLIYGIEDYAGDLTRKHLNDASNLYNTRIHAGLPPTAIGSPDLSSLLAVLNPSNEGYYYYVVDSEQGNRHHFSKTLSEHNSYVRALVANSRR